MSATRFVIVCFGRTGSTWLTTLLHSHPAVLCHGELFNPLEILYAPGYRQRSMVASAWSEASRDEDPAGFLEAVLADDGGHQAVGFKMLSWERPELIFELARHEDVRKVILRRRNRIRAFLSRKRSEAISRWVVHSYDGMRVRLDPDELFDYVKRYDKFYEDLRVAASGTLVHEVAYEELLEDDQRAGSIVEFLGVEPHDVPLHSTLPRQSNDLTRDVVTNFDELSALLRGTALEAELRA